MHKVPIHQMGIDTKAAIPVDPAESLPPLDGRHQEIWDVLANADGVQKWVGERGMEIVERVQELDQQMHGDQRCILHVAVSCKGGFQRSVVLATKLYDFVREFFRAHVENDCFPQFTFCLRHLTLEHTAVMKGWIHNWKVVEADEPERKIFEIDIIDE